MREHATSTDAVGTTAPCPVRPGDLCTRCLPGVHGPEDCGLAWLVGHPTDLYAEHPSGGKHR